VLNLPQNNQDFVNRLLPVWGKEEARAILRLCLDHIGQPGLALPGAPSWPEPVARQLGPVLERLVAGEPVQHVLGKAWFFGLELEVGPDVLIPRPETEELVEWVLEHRWENREGLLDLCTGSGCLALALKKHGRWASVAGLDVSRPALAMASQNALRLGLDCQWLELDLLDPAQEIEGSWEVWVSNPPYVAPEEAAQMDRNVLDFEPHLALFGPPGDVLAFYRELARRGRRNLVAGGWVYAELNPRYATEIADIFLEYGFEGVEIRRDISGKERMLRARRP
jgi:release factor glutamine methyltransferase